MLRRLRGAAFAAALVAGLGVSGAAHAQQTFRMAFQGNLNTLDPMTINETFTSAMLGSVYEGLTRRGPDLAIIPGLAERWEQPEPNRWRFYLRRGVTFHGGEPFTADDVVFSAERVRGATSDFKARIPADVQVVKVDDFTVDFVLTGPNPILNADWDTWYIMSKTWAERNNATQAVSSAATTPGFSTLNANGTGPFRIESHQPGVRTTLVRNPNWWNNGNLTHNLDRVIFTPIANEATRVAALLSGEVDWIDPVGVQDQDRINQNATTRMLTGPETRTIYLGFDHRRATLNAPAEIPAAPQGARPRQGTNPLQDVRVRRAFYQAIDENLIAQRIMRGQARPSALMIDPNLVDGGAQFQRLAFDPAASERLLDEAGYPRIGGAQGNRFTVGLDCPNDRYVNDAAICQAVIAMLARVGVRIAPIIQPRAQYFAKILAPRYDTNFYLLGWTPGTNDAHNVLAQLHGCRNDTGTGGIGVANAGGYCNQRVEELTRRILGEPNVATRNDLIRQAFRITQEEDVGYIPLHQQALAWGVSRRVEMAQRPDNIIMLYHVMMR